MLTSHQKSPRKESSYKTREQPEQITSVTSETITRNENAINQFLLVDRLGVASVERIFFVLLLPVILRQEINAVLPFYVRAALHRCSLRLDMALKSSMVKMILTLYGTINT